MLTREGKTTMSTDYLTIADAGAALRRGDVSAQELMARALSRAYASRL